MPNWCSVSVSVSGKKENVERMFRELTDLQKVKRENKGYGLLSNSSDWLGYVVSDIFGLKVDSDHAPRCRGYFTDFREDIGEGKDGNAVWFFAYEHAWGPAINFNIMLRKHYDVDLVWESEEPGMCEYLTNEPMEYSYFSHVEGSDYEFFASEREMIDDAESYVRSEFDTDVKFKSMEDAARYLDEEHDLFCEFGRYELVDDSDYILPMNEN